MRAEALLDRRQRGAVHSRPVGVRGHIADERQIGRAAVGIAIGPTEFAAGGESRQGLRRVLVDVLGVDVAVRVGSVIAVVHRRPHRPSGATARPVPLRTPVANGAPARRRRDPHDGRPRGIGVAVLGGDIACRADREIDRTVGSDGDALQRVRVGAAQFRAALVGKSGGDGSTVGCHPVGVVVGVDLVALGDIEGGAGERHPVRLVQPFEQHRLFGAAADFGASFRSARWTATTRAARRPVSTPRCAPWGSGPTPTSSSRRVSAPGVARRTGVGQIAGHVDRRGHQFPPSPGRVQRATSVRRARLRRGVSSNIPPARRCRRVRRRSRYAAADPHASPRRGSPTAHSR